jgi:branched-chain amino acid transport system ATP-binding protein
LSRIAKLFPRLEERRDQSAASLSGGEQQMLAIGRALMTNPRLLILDEATEGLAPLIRQEIWAAISHLKHQTGLAILLIDKSLKELSAISDNAVIVERGKTVWSGPMAHLTRDITENYLGV